MDFTLNIYTNLNSKYENKFNFYFSKSINQIVFNQTISVSTISFKDSAIYAQSIEYLKRQYFIINQVGIEQIFQRIHMLAGFYAGAILLRYQYPSMIITKTKEIFLKRLKRNKKMLTEEGSSDQSQEHSQSKTIQLHTNTFLASVNSSQLSKKTADLKDQAFPQILEKTTNQISFDTQIHDINNPTQIIQKNQIFLNTNDQFMQVLDESFAQKLQRLSKKAQLKQFINNQTVQINLNLIQSDISHLISDFDQIDKQQTMKNYLRLKNKQKQNYIDFGLQFPQFQQIIPNSYRNKKSTIFMGQSQQNMINQKSGKFINKNVKKFNNILNNDNPSQSNIQFYKKRPKQMKYSEIYDSQYENIKNKLKNQFRQKKENRNHVNNNQKKISGFYDNIRKSDIFSKTQSQQNRLNKDQLLQMEIEMKKSKINVKNSNIVKNKQLHQQKNMYQTNHYQRQNQYESHQPILKIDRNFIKKFPQAQPFLNQRQFLSFNNANNQEYENQHDLYYLQKPRQKVISHYESLQRNSKKFGKEKQYQMMLTQRQKQPNYYLRNKKYQNINANINPKNLIQIRNQRSPHNYNNYNSPMTMNRNPYTKYQTEYSLLQKMKKQRVSPNIQRNFPPHTYRRQINQNQMQFQPINISPATHRVFQKKSGFNIYSPSHYNSIRNTYTQPSNQLENQDKKEKKRKIRQKAAQLLHRVRSQEYLVGKGTIDNQYMHTGTIARGY